MIDFWFGVLVWIGCVVVIDVYGECVSFIELDEGCDVVVEWDVIVGVFFE